MKFYPKYPKKSKIDGPYQFDEVANVFQIIFVGLQSDKVLLKAPSGLD